MTLWSELLEEQYKQFWKHFSLNSRVRSFNAQSIFWSLKIYKNGDLYLVRIKMESAQSQLKGDILRCSSCSEMIKSRSRPVPGMGNSNAKVMMVGLAPGKDGADLTGIPFTRDPSGELINELIASIGLSREEDIFITNLVKCNPKDEKGRNRPPSKQEIANCCQYLKREIDCIKPRIIIAFGKDATEFLIDKRCVKCQKFTERWKP